MQTATKNPRDLAVQALRDREGNVSANIDRRIGSAGIAGPDEHLARELALGTARRRGTLDAIAKAFLNKPGRHLPGALNEVLAVGIYQLVYLDRVPAFAAVNEAVEQAGRFHHRRQSGLVNGLLRAVTRKVSDLQQGKPEPKPDVIPVSPGRYRKVDMPVFPDPAVKPEAYLAAAYSLPRRLAEKWLATFGSLARAVAVAEHANARAPLIARVNTLVSTPAAVVEELAAAGVAARPHANGLSIVLDDTRDVTALDAFTRGAIQPQDANATAVGALAAPKPGMRVLDFCAAPGTKTTHLAELMENRGRVVAVDVSQAKLQRVKDNCRRLGVTIVETMLAEAVGSLDGGSFDLVLADVPCGNTGVLARRAEARWRYAPEAISKLVEDQKFLIRAAAHFVKPGGRLVYSTCSVEPEENTQIARWLDRSDPRMRLVSEELSQPAGADDPTRWRDGGYCAVLEAR